ncbi:hypothetical protein DSM100688_0083 [Bifidobacterium ramosum]|uniref:ABC-2 family transporter protein n=1 Tax=Bifidobacterium ramosum TaxID=1798158 RepID=A0A6L4X1U4_9BIFI|nr:ABC-2 transporter permease [Bifidobacterium ramosum]KAB8289005.1 hypothetical protein DSM100688_0083 [Bifidobacterium ramosum]NEG70719.1 hypothetical protein [Bifidobacterium ramosum]
MTRTMHPVMRAFRMDWHKIASQRGWWWMPASVFVFPVPIANLAAASRSDTLVDWAMWLIVFMGVTMAACPFNYELQGESGFRLNGIMPVGRAHQVAARYLTLAVCAVMMLVSFAFSWCLLTAVGMGPSIGGMAVRAWAALLMTAVLYPMMYRFTMQQVFIGTMIVAMLAVVLSIPVLALVMTWPYMVTGDMWFGKAFAGVVPPVSVGTLLAIVAVAVLVVAYAVSFRLSVRWYRDRDL